jgi:dTDP-4-dehydrorhamnose reductase
MKRVLVTGAAGFLGSHIVPRLARDGYEILAAYHEALPRHLPQGARALRLDLTDDAAVEDFFAAHAPDAVVHAAAMTDLRQCELEPARAEKLNERATRNLTALCALPRTRFLFLSTDQVFDGEKSWYSETDSPRPIHRYGLSKLRGEEMALAMGPIGTVLRIALVYGESPGGTRASSEQITSALRAGRRPQLFTDEFRTPIFVDDVAEAIAELLPRDDVPLLHLAGPDRVSRREFGRLVAESCGLDDSLIDSLTHADVDLVPPRPKDLSLNTTRARQLLKHPPRALRDGLAQLVARATGKSGVRF